MKNDETWDDIIAPKLREIAQTCIDYGMPLLFVVEYDQDKAGEVRWFGEEESYLIKYMSETLKNHFLKYHKEIENGKSKEIQP